MKIDEKLISQYMKSLDLSREEAIQLIKDDADDEIGEEGEKMTEKAKELKRYEKAEKPKAKRQPPTRKPNENKTFLLREIKQALENSVEFTKITVETELGFVYNDQKYTVKLIQHR